MSAHSIGRGSLCALDPPALTANQCPQRRETHRRLICLLAQLLFRRCGRVCGFRPDRYYTSIILVYNILFFSPTLTTADDSFRSHGGMFFAWCIEVSSSLLYNTSYILRFTLPRDLSLSLGYSVYFCGLSDGCEQDVCDMWQLTRATCSLFIVVPLSVSDDEYEW